MCSLNGTGNPGGHGPGRRIPVLSDSLTTGGLCITARPPVFCEVHMSETAETATAQIGTTPNPVASNAQDFSGSDDEILDNFAEGVTDDGTPMGLGGEGGKQTEPASTTLEADLLSDTKQPGKQPDAAGDSAPVQGDTSEEASKTTTDAEPETKPETSGDAQFPPALLQMAGLADADAAKQAGFDSPDSLFAAIKWRGQLLSQAEQPVATSPEGLYRQRQTDESSAKTETSDGQSKPFTLPDDKLELFDEDLQEVIRDMNDHYQQELASLRETVSQRQPEQEPDESAQFDNLVQSLDEWQDVFGEGSGTELQRRGQSDPTAMTHFNHRAMLFDAVEAVREVNAKQGYKPMTLEQEVHWALMQRYPDKFQTNILGASSGSGRNVSASRPTQRRTPPKTRDDKTLVEVDRMMRDRHGYGIDMGQDEEFDGEI